MIRSQLKPGDRIIGKYYKGNLSFKGILIKKIDSHSYLFFVEELGSETNIGYKKYSEVDILIYDKQETLLFERTRYEDSHEVDNLERTGEILPLEEVLTHYTAAIREAGKRHIKLDGSLL